jgi:hypothetical protein
VISDAPLPVFTYVPVELRRYGASTRLCFGACAKVVAAAPVAHLLLLAHPLLL